MKRLLTSSFLVLLTIALLPWTGSAQDLENDSLALVALYNDCNGANWMGFDSWMTDSIKNWKDVTVSDVEGSPRVTIFDRLPGYDAGGGNEDDHEGEGCGERLPVPAYVFA